MIYAQTFPVLVSKALSFVHFSTTVANPILFSSDVRILAYIPTSTQDAKIRQLWTVGQEILPTAVSIIIPNHDKKYYLRL
jgi:hypothetical protein